MDNQEISGCPLNRDDDLIDLGAIVRARHVADWNSHGGSGTAKCNNVTARMNDPPEFPAAPDRCTRATDGITPWGKRHSQTLTDRLLLL